MTSYHKISILIFPMTVCLFLIFTGTKIVPASDITSQIEQEIQENPELLDRQKQREIAWGYNLGRGVPQDLPKAVAWMRKSAEQGYDAAQSDLGLLYEKAKG